MIQISLTLYNMSMFIVFMIKSLTILDNRLLKLIIILNFLIRRTHFFPATALAFLFTLLLCFRFLSLYIVILNVKFLYFVILFIFNVFDIYGVFNLSHFFYLLFNLHILILIWIRIQPRYSNLRKTFPSTSTVSRNICFGRTHKALSPYSCR